MSLPRYLAILKHPRFIEMGLTPLEPLSWLEIDSGFQQYQQNKLGLYHSRPANVFAATEESKCAQLEFSEYLSSHLHRFHPPQHQPQPHKGGPHFVSSVDFGVGQSSLAIQEDICLLEKKKGVHVLTAASLCAPSDWLLEEKIGRPMAAIHSSVPGLNDQLEGRIEDFLTRIRADQFFQRFNWSIKLSDSLALFPSSEGQKVKQVQSLDDLYLRVERQVFTRLPETGAIVFTIRVYIDSFSIIRENPVAFNILKDSLKEAIEQMTGAQREYKSLDHVLNLLL